MQCTINPRKAADGYYVLPGCLYYAALSPEEAERTKARRITEAEMQASTKGSCEQLRWPLPRVRQQS